MRFIPERLIYSFSIQLVVMHLKKNQLLLMYWVLLFGFVSQSFSKRFGIPYLFLDPEYVGHVNLVSFFIVGLSVGVFIMAFNISSYILNSFRFPFLASLSRSFEKYTYNNSIIPAAFVLVYVIEIIHFQYFSQLKSALEIALDVLGFLGGIFIVIGATLRYFVLTNQDIYVLFGVQHADNPHLVVAGPAEDRSKSRYQRKKSSNDKEWRVHTYLSFPFNTRLVRSTDHYKDYMLQSVFKQNHINAAVMELIVFVVFIALGLFREFDYFQIPAAGSVLLLFTIFIMFSGVLKFWLKSWASTAIIVCFLILNYFSQFDFFTQRSKAIGLDYLPAKKEYSLESLEKSVSKDIVAKDKKNTIAILERWKQQWQQKGVEKPKLVVTIISGGGLRSSLFTFRTMQALDSVLDGELMHHTRLITGSSGGAIGAAYYRGLFMENKAGLLDLKGKQSERHLDNIAKDLLNTTAFSFTVSDVFLSTQSFKARGNTYYKDRGYAFEKQLNENLGQVLNKSLGYYREPELKAEIPMMIMSPSIVNDGRTMMISPIGVSYMLQQPFEGNTLEPIPDGIEYTRFFEDHDPLNTRFSSILRMNATFPYIMPATSMPTEPSIEVMDAGLRDNYGVLNAVRFLFEFKEWIQANTGGVVFIQIRDTNKKSKPQNTSLTTILSKLTSPVRNVSGNFILMQDYLHDDYLKYLVSWIGCPFDFVQFQLPQMEDKIALSWHLTTKEKLFLKEAIYTPENRTALNKVSELLNYHIPAKGIASEKISKKQAHGAVLKTGL